MKRYALPSLVLAAWLALSVLSVSTAFAGGATCTRTGTNDRDRIYGTRRHDVLCLKSGRDYGNARGAADTLKGGPDADTLVGGPGADMIHGLQGPDDLFATDGETNDTLDGGTGRDNCYGDTGDTFLQTCEHSVRV